MYRIKNYVLKFYFYDNIEFVFCDKIFVFDFGFEFFFFVKKLFMIKIELGYRVV